MNIVKKTKWKRIFIFFPFALLLLIFKDYFLDFISPYSYYDDVKNACSQPVFAIFLVTTRPAMFSLRKTIRETWGANLESYNSKIFFILGLTSDPEAQEQIEDEYSTYFDLVQIDFVDSYFNLSIKSVMLLKWAVDNCLTNAKYVIKVDDDTYINMKLLMNLLKENQNKNMLLGSININSEPIRSKFNKWYCPPEFYYSNTYPPYLTGFCYIMTMNTASILYEKSRKIPFFHLEDVLITGLAAKEANIDLVHNDMFFKDQVPLKKLVQTKFIAVHYVKENRMRIIHLMV